MSSDDLQKLETQLQSFQGFINLIKDKHLQEALKLSKTKTIKLGNKTYTKKPLTSKQFTEISKLYAQLDNPTLTPDTQIDTLVELRKKSALYYYGIPEDVFDTNFEKLNPIMEGCVLVTSAGLSPDIDLDKLLVEYQNSQNKK